MNALLQSPADVQEAVRSAERVLPVGGGTKPALSGAPSGAMTLDCSGLRGIVQYDPAELTLTALAGTPVDELQDELARHGQCLAFDPPWRAAGATLGGTIAAAASGPNAFRFGGIRDAVLAVQFVDGVGRALGGGAPIVKNAAGFDLPKLFVGSAGRLGVLTRVTCKVLPAPVATATVVLSHGSLAQALATMLRLARGPLAFDALELEPPGRLLARLGGAPEALADRARRVIGLARDDATTPPSIPGGERQQAVGWLADVVGDAPDAELIEDDAEVWRGIAERDIWAMDARLVRVPLTPHDVESLQALVEANGGHARYSLGANVAWISWPAASSLDPLDALLLERGLAGTVMRRADAGRIRLGQRRGGAFAARIRATLDPNGRFSEDR